MAKLTSILLLAVMILNLVFLGAVSLVAIQPGLISDLGHLTVDIATQCKDVVKEIKHEYDNLSDEDKQELKDEVKKDFGELIEDIKQEVEQNKSTATN